MCSALAASGDTATTSAKGGNSGQEEMIGGLTRLQSDQNEIQRRGSSRPEDDRCAARSMEDGSETWRFGEAHAGPDTEPGA